jgi:predicted MPP superfamily phosphohydrolase
MVSFILVLLLLQGCPDFRYPGDRESVIATKGDVPDIQFSRLNDNLPDTSWQFSIAHITDLHIGEGEDDYGSPGYDDTLVSGSSEGTPALHLRNAVKWINANASRYKITLVMVTGDFTDSAEKSEFLKAKELLDNLTVYLDKTDIPAYIPVLGNHDIWPYTSESEAESPIGDRYFKDIFASHFSRLKSFFSRWDDGTRLTRTYNPEAYCYSYFQNFAFDYAGYHFIVTDFNTREPALLSYKGALGEADLQDFSGGTWRWFQSHYNSYPYYAADNILVFDHHPLTKDITNSITSFNYEEYNKIATFLNNNSHKYYTGLWCAGHIHRHSEYGIGTLGPLHFSTSTVCRGIETDALKENSKNIRIIKVWGKTSKPDPGGVILYEHTDYEGRGELFVGNDSDLRNNVFGNDEVSSHRIMGKGKIDVYKDINYNGTRKTFNGSVADYRQYSINDWVSSLRYYDNTETPVPTASPTPVPTSLPNHAPRQPSNPKPPDLTAGVSLHPTLCVDVSDPDGDTMNVTFYGKGMLDSGRITIKTISSVPDGGRVCCRWPRDNYGEACSWWVVADDGKKKTQSPVWNFTIIVC